MKRKNHQKLLMGLMAVLATALVVVLCCITVCEKNLSAANVSLEEQVFFTDTPDAIETATPFPSPMVLQSTPLPAMSLVSENTPYQRQIASTVSLSLNAKPGQPFTRSCAYRVELKYFDADQLARYFWPDTYSQLKKEAIEGVERMDAVDGSSLRVTKYMKMPTATSEFTYSTKGFDAIKTLFSFGDEVDDNSNYFTRDVDLDFMSRDEAAERGREIARDLGIPVMPDPRVITLDTVSLTSAVREVKKSDYWDILKPSARKLCEEEWTEKDEYYVVLFDIALEDKPVGYYPNVGFNETIPAQSVFSVAFNREGLAGANAYSVFQTMRAGDAQNIITFDEAVDALTRYYDPFIDTRPIGFMRAELVLTPEWAEENVLRLTPAWVFSYEVVLDGKPAIGYQNRTIDKTIWLDRVFVNAITGEVSET